LDLQYIGEGAYQVFAVNDGYDCDFIEIVVALPERQGHQTVYFTAWWRILTPFVDGSHIFVDTYKPASNRPRPLYLIDTKRRKPTRLIEALQTRAPGGSRLPKTVGGVHQLIAEPRTEALPIRQYIEHIRFDFKQRYLHLRREYVDLVARDTPLSGLRELWADNPRARQLLGQLRALRTFELLYNAGVTPKAMKDADEARHYEWFIRDWGLPAPDGVPPTLPFDIERVVTEESGL
jgi:hypothetical protein